MNCMEVFTILSFDVTNEDANLKAAKKTKNTKIKKSFASIIKLCRHKLTYTSEHLHNLTPANESFYTFYPSDYKFIVKHRKLDLLHAGTMGQYYPWTCLHNKSCTRNLRVFRVFSLYYDIVLLCTFVEIFLIRLNTSKQRL